MFKTYTANQVYKSRPLELHSILHQQENILCDYINEYQTLTSSANKRGS